jgi:hypothetical protein
MTRVVWECGGARRSQTRRVILRWCLGDFGLACAEHTRPTVGQCVRRKKGLDGGGGGCWMTRVVWECGGARRSQTRRVILRWCLGDFGLIRAEHTRPTVGQCVRRKKSLDGGGGGRRMTRVVWECWGGAVFPIRRVILRWCLGGNAVSSAQNTPALRLAMGFLDGEFSCGSPVQDAP